MEKAWNTPGDKEEFRVDNKYAYTNISYKESLGKGWKIQLGTSYSTNRDKLYMDTINKSAALSHVNARQDFTQLRAVLSKNLGQFSILRFGSEFQYADERSALNNMHADYTDSYTATFAEADVISHRVL